MHVTIEPEIFKKAISQMVRFPMTSALAGSELLYLRTDTRKEVLSIYGGISVIAKMVIPVSGVIDKWLAIDSRALQPFAQRLTAMVELRTSTKHNQVKLTSGENELTVPLLFGPDDAPKIDRGIKIGVVQEKDIKALRYLAGIVPDVQTRPDLSCLVVTKIGEQTGSRAIACSQRVMAVVHINGFEAGGTLAIPLARQVEAGDHFFAGGGDYTSTLRSAGAQYTAALPEESVKFPLEGVNALLRSKAEEVGSCDGSEFSQACTACRDCLGFVTKLGAYLELTPIKGGMQMLAESGGASFRTKIRAEIKSSTRKFYMPIDEAANLAPLWEDKQLTFRCGTKNGELFIFADDVKVVIASGQAEG